jgi:hypothetical protein
MNSTLLDVQNKLRQSGILICFSGRLSQGLIEEYGEAVKTYLETEDRPMNEIYNVFAIFIEQTQNIKNYNACKQGSAAFGEIASSAIVTIGKTADSYYVCSGNLIEDADIAMLTETIKEVAGLDKDGLKRLYKEKLRREMPEGSSGAGIGLVEMARKASAPLQYSFTPVAEGLSFFTLKALI